jgi:hypothetical protein
MMSARGRQWLALLLLKVKFGLLVFPNMADGSAVTRLWHSSGRSRDRYGLQAACEAAAATASIIMGQWNVDEDERINGSAVGMPTGSMMGMPYGTPAPPQIDPYMYDDAVIPKRRRRHRRGSSMAGSGPTIINVGGGGGPQPTYGNSYNTAPMGGMPGSAPSTSLLSQGSPYMGSSYGASYGVPQTIAVGGNGLAGNGYGMPQSATMVGGGGSILTGGLPPQMQAQYQANMAQAYPNAMPNIGGTVPGQILGGMGQQMGQTFGGQPNTIVIPPPRSRHRSRSRMRERERERGNEEDRDRDERRSSRRSRRYSDVGPTGFAGVGGFGGAGGLGSAQYPGTYSSSTVSSGAPPMAVYRY